MTTTHTATVEFMENKEVDGHRYRCTIADASGNKVQGFLDFVSNDSTIETVLKPGSTITITVVA